MMFLLASCTTMRSVQEKVMAVEKGMTKDQVLRILGTPTARNFTDDYEELEFRFVDSLYGTVKVVVVEFDNGRVVGMDSFSPSDMIGPPPPPIIP